MKLHIHKLLYLIILPVATLFHQQTYAQGNNFIVISGKIIDEATKEPLPGVNVLIKGTVNGISTGSNGEFNLKTKARFPFTLVVSSVGFQTQEFEVKGTDSRINIAMVTQTQLGQEVVITASRVEESILKSPVAIEKLDIRAIRESPAPSFYDALENVKGVQMITSSLTFKVPNTRGFNIPNNFRFMQLVDGVDMQAATLGVPLGNAIGPTELDIASVEITPGAASALYGMNAINGMANLITKSPFLYQGLSFYQKTGVNHIGGTGRDLSNLTETSIRYAKAFNNKFAFKVNLSYLRGTDWVSDTRTNQNPNNLITANPAYPELNADADNPAYDAWNKYGDDSGSNAVTISGLTIPGKGSANSIITRRTGYWEKDVVSPNIDNLKFDAALHYRLNDNAELSYSYRIGKMDGVFQRGNKIQLDNVIVQNHKLELKGDNYFIRTYMSSESTGDSYNIKPLVDNLDLTNKSNSVWGADFKTAAQNALNGGSSLADALRLGRIAADAGRAEPGTAQFNELKKTIISINNWDHAKNVAGAPATGGAWLKQESHTYHADAQWNLSKYTKVLDLLIGADARIYEVIPDGNNFVDFKRPVADRNKPLADGSFGDNVYYKKFGAFSQITKTFFDEKLKLFGSIRVDYNPEFEAKINPRVAAVYTVAKRHNFRASFQNGYRFPALFEAVSFVNNGNIRRVGGLSYINEGLNYLDNSYTLSSINVFNAKVNADVKASGGTLTETQAAINNKALLEITSLSATRPERINSFEVGYKSILLDNKLVVDIDAYVNQYDGFLGQVEVAVPYAAGLANQLTVGSDDAAIAALASKRNAQQTRYRVYTNAKNKYNNYGSSLGITYNFFEKYTVVGNVSFNDITKNKQADVFVTGFNTPKWSTNVSFGNREILKNLGFNIAWKWQEEFLWESPLVNGTVPAFNTFDAQVTYRVPQSKATLKVGGTNIFNKNYVQYAGGPTLGALYYAAVTLDGLLTK
ncbi:iron complex outermembrane receptor protein [Pedobacter africanus]|uniref:Outer membrane receptor protein involved in Fe transport n=1 Tax=Pedobacter africanus TaxID=151894 RepID=A0ACC6KSC9_9SPHI|nr:TonB-dependent receptor [Pedobacter africanus]MDR6782260.1 outer membrane receptor protein involved in Fe transport [Pedobacter africanus]